MWVVWEQTDSNQSDITGSSSISGWLRRVSQGWLDTKWTKPWFWPSTKPRPTVHPGYSRHWPCSLIFLPRDDVVLSTSFGKSLNIHLSISSFRKTFSPHAIVCGDQTHSFIYIYSVQGRIRYGSYPHKVYIWSTDHRIFLIYLKPFA